MEYINLNPTYRGRVRSGCLTCRTKRVKCTEERPVCKPCTRLKRECIYGAASPNQRQPRRGTRSRPSYAGARLPVLRPLGEDASIEGDEPSPDQSREGYQADVEASTSMQDLSLLLSPTASTTPKTISAALSVRYRISGRGRCCMGNPKDTRHSRSNQSRQFLRILCGRPGGGTSCEAEASHDKVVLLSALWDPASILVMAFDIA